MTRSPYFRASGRTPLIVGAVLWCLCLQFFVCEQIARHAWTTPYSWTRNYISDLGAIRCANRPSGSANYVCSPRHDVMNGSFAAQGLLIAGGAALLGGAFPKQRAGTIGRSLLGLAGAGVFAVGLVPEDTVGPVHLSGAAIHFLCGNAALVLLGVAALRAAHGMRVVPDAFARAILVAGVTGLAATVLVGVGVYPGVGVGGMERIAAYPLPLCLAGIGAFLLAVLHRLPPREPSEAPRAL